MKITFTEHEGCFSFDLIAESLPDAALLARAAMNTKQINTTFTQSGEVWASLVLQKPRDNKRQSILCRPSLNRRA